MFKHDALPCASDEKGFGVRVGKGAKKSLEVVSTFKPIAEQEKIYEPSSNKSKFE